jgi:hypothetical protein
LPNRALIIAIEHYGAAQGLSSADLPGVREAALKFYEWVRYTRKVEKEHIFVCSDGMALPKDHPQSISVNGSTYNLIWGASRADIVGAIGDLISVGASQTPILFVYCAGHGFVFNQNSNAPGVNFFVAADYQNLNVGGNSCIGLDEIQSLLRLKLAGLDHFYFVDACRNLLDANRISPISLGLSFPNSPQRQAHASALYSARYGEGADADAAFNDTLVAGLAGAGHAKEKIGVDVFVTFRGLKRYLEKELKRTIDAPTDGEGKINLLLPPVQQMCTLKVLNTENLDALQAVVTLGDGFSRPPIPFIGATLILPLKPNDAGYHFSVTQSGVALMQVDPPSDTLLDMYDDCSVSFEPYPAESDIRVFSNDPLRSSSDVRWRSSNVRLRYWITADAERYFYPNWEVTVDNGQPKGLMDGAVKESLLLPGKHSIRLTEDGMTVAHYEVSLRPGKEQEIELGQTAPERFHRAVVDLIAQPDSRTPVLSEALGATADWDTNLWLAYLGTSSIRPDPNMYQKLGKIGLPSAPSLGETAAAALVLIVTDQGTPEVALHTGSEVAWQQMRPVVAVPSLFYLDATMPQGARAPLFSIKLEGRIPLTYATSSTPGGFTLITCANSEAKGITMEQFFIPPIDVGASWRYEQLSDLKTVRILSNALRSFRERKPVWNGSFAPLELWADLRAGRWGNRELAALCVYDLLRRGEDADIVSALVAAAKRSSSNEMEGDFSVQEPESARGSTAPLLLDSLLADPHYAEHSVLPAGRLNFRDMWVRWEGAVTTKDAGKTSPLPDMEC